MVLEAEARRGQIAEVARALLDLEHARAGAAVEVMMVSLARDLKARRFAGQVDLHHFAFGHQRFERSIHRRDAHAAHASLGEPQHLSRGDRAVGFLNRLADCFALLGATFHEQKSSVVKVRPTGRSAGACV